MSRQTWMDRVIETARTEKKPMPWSRTARAEAAKETAPVKIKAQA